MLVRVDAESKIYVDTNSMSMAEFPDNLQLIKNSGKYSVEKPVYIQADKKIIYDNVMFVLKTLKQAGFNKVVLQTNG